MMSKEKKKFVEGKGYQYETIEKFINSTHGEADLEEFGYNVIGQHFLLLYHEEDFVSFVLSGASSTGHIYQAIASEI